MSGRMVNEISFIYTVVTRWPASFFLHIIYEIGITYVKEETTFCDFAT